jgi:hypothetical protein
MPVLTDQISEATAGKGVSIPNLHMRGPTFDIEDPVIPAAVGASQVDGTGSSVSTAGARAILAAASAAGGGNVVFQPGRVYKFDDQLTIPSNVTVWAYGSTTNYVAYGAGLPGTTGGPAVYTPLYANTGNGVRMSSRSRWFGGTIYHLLSASLSGGVGYSGAFQNIFAIGHVNNYTQLSAAFGTFVEDVIIRDINVNLNGTVGWNQAIAIYGAVRGVVLHNIGDTRIQYGGIDASSITCEWGGDNGLTYHPYSVTMDTIRTTGINNTANLGRGLWLSGAYDVTVSNYSANDIQYPITYYIGDPGDPGGTGGTSAGVVNSAQAGRIGSLYQLDKFRAENFNIGLRFLGDASGGTHQERRTHALRVIARNVALRGQGPINGVGSWASNLGIYSAQASSWQLESFDISNVHTPISCAAPPAATAITSISATGGVATAVLAAHGLVVGQIINVSGWTQPEYNGQKTVLTAPSGSFTYAVTGTPAAGTGTGVFVKFLAQSDISITNGEVRNSYRGGLDIGEVDGVYVSGVRIHDLNAEAGANAKGVQAAGRNIRVLSSTFGRSPGGATELLRFGVQINAPTPAFYIDGLPAQGNVIQQNHFRTLAAGGAAITGAGQYWSDDSNTFDNGIIPNGITHPTPHTVRVAADQAIAVLTATNVTSMVQAVQANEVWEVVWEILYTNNATTTTASFAVTVPAGSATFTGTVYGGTGTAGTAFLEKPLATSGTLVTLYGGNTTVMHATVKLHVLVGSTAGTIQLQAASSVAVAAGVTIKAGSYMVATRIAL